jgi:hypothetical protein
MRGADARACAGHGFYSDSSAEVHRQRRPTRPPAPRLSSFAHNVRHVTGRKRALQTSRAFARLRPRFCVSGTGTL